MALVCASLLMACASRSHPAGNPLFDLDGTWSGEVKGIRAAGLSTRPLDYELWVTIDGERAELWYRYEGQWVRPWNGVRPFAMTRFESNAVMHASQSKPQVECHWVETWNLTASQFRPGWLHTIWTRVVNNSGCPDVEGGQFITAAAGQLTRISEHVTLPEPAGTY